jgi:DNA-binding protein Fis
VNEQQLSAEFDLSRQNEVDGAPVVGSGDLAGYALQHLQTQANVNLDQVLKTWEKAYVDAAMRLTHGNLSQAAKMLGVNRTTLYSRIQLQE